MALSINTQSLQTDSVTTLNNYSGILNSNYKSIVISNFKNISSKSLFSSKQRLKSWSYNKSCCTVATSLKLLLFVVMIILAII
ncbi:MULTISPECIES: hypothetical protein [unclassified Olleya]|uniref:hypothetical protein n=1 Tax=unclassified Olleya TaxID=2615019 RepID=UPI0011A3D505|nr:MULTISPECIES: hypothetical protein [unclassified Olleya]TVZ48545.1 hypothetical protein JM82_3192 [Olleya sp. Hel_I_94]